MAADDLILLYVFWDLTTIFSYLLGAVLAVSGTLGIVRFPDVLSRLHAATKPQVLGLRLMRSGCVFLRGAQSAPWS